MISLKNDKIYTLVNNVVLLEEEGSTYNNNNKMASKTAAKIADFNIYTNQLYNYIF